MVVHIARQNSNFIDHQVKHYQYKGLITKVGSKESKILFYL